MEAPPATRVFWDLETTDRVATSRIVSIGWATCYDSPTELLVLPAEESTPSALQVHCWTRDALARHGALSVEAQLGAFFERLLALGPVVLCAHNGKAFDTRVLRSEMARANLHLPPNVVGFVDTLHWLRSTVGIRPTGLDHLVRLAGGSERGVHSAGQDAALLCRIADVYRETHPLTHFETLDDWLRRTQDAHEKAIRSEVRSAFDQLVLQPTLAQRDGASACGRVME